MKKISLQEAFDILQNCSAVVMDDNFLVYPSLDNTEIVGDPKSRFLFLKNENNYCEYNFFEGDNQEVEVVGSSMFLYEEHDEDGLPSQLTILCPQNLE